MGGAVSLLPLYDFITWTRTTFFTFKFTLTVDVCKRLITFSVRYKVNFYVFVGLISALKW